MSSYKFESYPDPRFQDTQFVVEATHTEMSQLWARYERRSTWVQDMRGFFQTVGEIRVDGEMMPVCVSGFWYTINGVRVLFYESTSLVTHNGWVEEWVMEACGNPKHDFGTRISHVDAGNFHNCLHEIERISGIKLKPYVDCRCYE